MSFKLDTTERLFMVPDPSGNGQQMIVAAKQGATGPEVRFYVENEGESKFISSDEYFDDYRPDIKKGGRIKALENMVNGWKGSLDATHTFTFEGISDVQAAQTIIELSGTLANRSNADSFRVKTPVTMFYTPKGETTQTTWALDYEWDSGIDNIKIKNAITEEAINGKNQKVSIGKVYPVMLQSDGSTSISRNAATRLLEVNGKGREVKLVIKPEKKDNGLSTGLHEFTLEVDYDGTPLRTSGRLIEKAGTPKTLELDYAQTTEWSIGKGLKLTAASVLGLADLKPDLDEALSQLDAKTKYTSVFGALDGKLGMRPGIPVVLDGVYKGRDDLRQFVYLDESQNIHVGVATVEKTTSGALQVIGVNKDQSIQAYIQDEVASGRRAADVETEIATKVQGHSSPISRQGSIRVLGKFDNTKVKDDPDFAEQKARIELGKPATDYVTADELAGRSPTHTTTQNNGGRLGSETPIQVNVNPVINVPAQPAVPSQPAPVAEVPSTSNRTQTPPPAAPAPNTPAPAGLGGTALIGGIGAIVGGIVGSMANNPMMGAAVGGVIGLIASQIPAFRDLANRIVGHTNNPTIQNTYQNVMSGGQQMAT